MELKAYFVSAKNCGHCDIALNALDAVHGEKWKPVMEIIDTKHEIAKENKVLMTPTLLVVDTENENKTIAVVSGSNKLDATFWSQFFTFVNSKSDTSPL